MTTVLLPGTTDAINAVIALSAMPGLRYGYGLDRIDIDGNVLASIDVLGGDGAPHVTRDCTAVTPGACTFRTAEPLAWGADLVAPWMEISSVHYNGGEHYRFPLGVYIATSPEQPLDEGIWDVTGYDKVYLLKNDIGDAFVVKGGDFYSKKIATLLDRAGIPDVKLGDGTLNPDVIDFPNDWAARTFPTDGSKEPMIFLCDDSNNYQYLDVINSILDATGCRTIYTGPTGKFAIAKRVKPINQSPRFDFMRSFVNDLYTPDFEHRENVVKDSTRYASDLWGVPNRIVFIQTGLTFDPIEGSGQFTIDNSITDPDHYRPPGDQQTVGRVILSIQRVDAVDQSDLEDQAEKLFTDIYSGAERIELSTAPWPCAWHYDSIRYLDAELPRASGRKVQAQSWDLALNGDDMTWVTNVVADLPTDSPS